MQHIQSLSRYSRRVSSIAAAFSIAAGASGCGMFGSSDIKQPMNASVENTSGEGTVEAKHGDNGNTDIEVQVKHLSSPYKVAADAAVYVVWLQPHNAKIQNIGALEVDDNLVGTFNTTTPHRSFTLSVTPEPSARMSAPTHGAVFTSEVALADD